MATLRDIRQRIGGVKSTQKITKAMKMVAAAKLRRAQDAIISTRPYARKMRELLEHLAGIVDVTEHPLFAARPVEKICIIVVTGDRGLCGAFNSNVLRTTVHHITENYSEQAAHGNVSLICVGRKGADFFRKREFTIVKNHAGIFGSLQFGNAKEVHAEAEQGFLKGEFDRVIVIYNEFKSIVHQRVAIEQILPIAPPTPKDGKKPQAIDYIYEPSSESLIQALVPKHLDFHMWRVLLDSNAAEQGARMTAMDNATTNASDLIKHLQLSYNKARQAAITKELLEIVSGAEALNKAG
jgi:F-type H+-transporting ATPase subunit gamma